MYIFIKCLAKTSRSWAEIDISNISLKDLYKSYHKVLIVVSNPFAERLEEVDLNDIHKEVVSYSGNIVQFLASLENKSLPTRHPITKLENRVVVEYGSLPLNGYSCNFTNLNYHSNTDINRAVCEDVLITRPDTDYEKLYKHMVFSIGGYICLPHLRDDGIVLQGGLNILDKMGRDTFGAFNLGQMGEIKYLPISSDNIRQTTPVANIASDKMFISHGDSINYLDYHIFLVFGGKFHPSAVKVVGSELAVVSLVDYPLVHHYLDTKQYQEYEALKEIITENQYEVVAKLFSNEGMNAWFEDESTFFIAVKREAGRDICIDTTTIPHSGNRGIYKVTEPPKGILFNSRGNVMDFISIPHDGHYTVNTMDDLVPNWVASPRVQWNESKVITSMKDRTKPYSYSDATLMSIYYLV